MNHSISSSNAFLSMVLFQSIKVEAIRPSYSVVAPRTLRHLLHVCVSMVQWRRRRPQVRPKVHVDSSSISNSSASTPMSIGEGCDVTIAANALAMGAIDIEMTPAVGKNGNL